ncbi:MAG TPA: GNAT family protein [Chloroflexota bacterium]|nr:GNAT family protein [Chloroflexota bacterium]
MREIRPILIDLPEKLVGQRIVVRPWREADTSVLYALVDQNRAHIRRWLPWADGYHSIDDARAFVRRSTAHWALREDLGMAILDHGGQLLGGIGLHPRVWQVPAFEIGYWIAEPHQGKGYVAEAVKLVTGLAFDVLHARRVMIRCDARNDRSAAVARRCGYVFEGTFRSDSIAADGSLGDTMVFSLLPAEYAATRGT